jgi:hypothetical protein
MSPALEQQKRMALRIPTGWAVVHNTFGDEDPILADNRILNDEYYSEDLLSLQQIAFTNSGWQAKTDGFLVDLGWYPSGSPQGRYRLVLLKGDWDHIVLDFSSRKRQEIRGVIESCLDLIARDTPLAALPIQALATAGIGREEGYEP